MIDRIVYYDHRFGDRYEVELDENCRFDFALRFMDGQIANPIVYQHLCDISPAHRAEIEKLIQARQRYHIPK